MRRRPMDAAPRLLLLEDDAELARVLARGLREEGCQVEVHGDGEDAWQRLQDGEHDLLLCDLMVPGRSGIAVITAARSAGLRLPILVFSARDQIADRIAALDAGADDYLVKPVDFDELLARLRAQWRRQLHFASEVIEAADLRLDPAGREARLRGRSLSLSPREFDLLDYFIRHPDQVLSRAALHQAVWQVPYDGRSNVVDVYVQYLRRKTEGDGGRRLIHTVRGEGYRFVSVAAG